MFFTSDEATLVEAAVDRLIPPDDRGPGGKDAGCAVFIDRQLAGPYGRAEGLYMRPPFMPGAPTQGYQSPDAPAARYRAGLKAVADYVKTTFSGKSFAGLAPADQDKVLAGLETGSIAIKAALTGHLVLSTLHTNDAPSTVTRMIDMGIEPFNVASAVNLIVAQRLVRRVCSECKQEHTYTAEEIHAFGIAPAEAAKLTFYKGAGCDTCSGSGYKGRQGLYEVMAMTSAVRRMVLKGGSTEELREQAVKDGMLTLRMDGMLKVKRGITTLEEVVKETAA